MTVLLVQQAIHACIGRIVMDRHGTTACKDCMLCPAGYHVDPPCHTGHVYSDKVYESCARCKDGEYKDTDRGQRNDKNCSSCASTRCGNHVVLSPCTKISPFKCSHECKDGYHDDGLGNCVAVCIIHSKIFIIPNCIVGVSSATFVLEFQAELIAVFC